VDRGAALRRQERGKLRHPSARKRVRGGRGGRKSGLAFALVPCRARREASRGDLQDRWWRTGERGAWMATRSAPLRFLSVQERGRRARPTRARHRRGGENRRGGAP